jgi:hypothetical protein
MPQRYRKRPVVVEAAQIDSNDYDGMCEIAAWCGGHTVDDALHVLAIDTLEGEMYADPGDWIIQGVAGEFYPCKPDIFAVLYEQVAADA